MRYKDLNSSLEAHIISLRISLIVVVVLVGYMWYGWRNATDDITVHIPPDTRSGAVLQSGDINDANVYSFALHIFQQINHWSEDGMKNYGEQIHKTRHQLTPEFYEYLKEDMNTRHENGELKNRVRYVLLIEGKTFEKRRVDILDAENWIVWLDLGVYEHVHGMSVKTVYIRYPLLVTRYNIDKEKNAWGLALKGFAGEGPKKLTEEQLAGASK